MRMMFKKLQGFIRLLFFAFFLRPSEDTKEEPCCKTIAESYRVQWKEHSFQTEVISDKK